MLKEGLFLVSDQEHILSEEEALVQEEPPSQFSYEQNSDENEQEVRSRLEEQAPGCTTFLEEKHNITHFARYPDTVLLDMYERRNDRDMPWGVMIVAKADHNGAFYHQDALAELHNEFGGQFQTRIIEADTVEEALALTQALVTEYGQASYGMLCAHGHEDGFHLGEEGTGDTEENPDLHTSHLGTMLELSELLQTSLKEEAEICFVSCSTGKNADSIAPQVANLSERTTHAPTTDTNIDSFGAHRAGGVLRFNPEYTEGNARKTEAGEGIVNYDLVQDIQRVRNAVVQKNNFAFAA